MKTTITKLATILNVSRETIEQVDSKQLFIVSHVDYKLYFSYDTCIGIHRNNADFTYLSDTYYSRTTSRHKNIIKKLRKFATLPACIFDDLYDCLSNHG